MRTTKVYKVVRPVNGRLRSALECVSRSRSIGLSYGIGQVTLPKIGKIFAFRTLENAESYVGHSSIWEIWEARATNVKIGKRRVYLHTTKSVGRDIKAYWTSLSTGSLNRRLTELMPVRGTVFCDSLTLTRRIK